MGHLNGSLARVGGNLNNNFQKSQMPGGLPGGGMLKLRFDRYIIKTFCHRKYLNRRNVYSSGHQGTFNPAVIMNKEVHMVHGNINTNDETSHTTSNAKTRSLKISDYFSKQNGKPSLSGE